MTDLGERSIRRRSATAHHEAGHYVIGEVLQVGWHHEVTIEPEVTEEGVRLGAAIGEFDAHVRGSGSGTASDPYVEHLDPAKARNAVISLYAGAEAQIEFGDSKEEAAAGAGDDDEQAADILRAIAAEHDAPLVREEARQLVRKFWPAIVAVASELVRYGRLPEHHAGLVFASATESDPMMANVYRQILEEARREREEFDRARATVVDLR